MAELKLDFQNITGKIKPMHSVGQPPWFGIDGRYLHYLTDAHIPYSRLHDMGGAYGGCVYVDIPNIFRNFDADAENPESYDFAFTDVLISAMMKNNIKPIYRLGVTIENNAHIKRYRTFPPSDPAKWAKICEMIIRHYNEGWADGFEYGIEYWEIWNEPDSDVTDMEKSSMWYGTSEQYYELYQISSKHLKNCFGDSIKVGGYAGCGFCSVTDNPQKYGIEGKNRENPRYASGRYLGFIDFFIDFLNHIKQTGSPLDFFSWHSYSNVEDTVLQEKYAEKILLEYGYGKTEIHLNEWNNAPKLEYRGTSYASANAAAMLCAMHGTKADILCYYDARLGPSVYGGLFNPSNHKPCSTYYTFAAFGELYVLGNCVECECGGIYSLAAVSDDGTKKAVMLANIGDDAVVSSKLENMKAYLVDEEHFLTETEADLKNICIKKNQVLLIKNY